MKGECRAWGQPLLRQPNRDSVVNAVRSLGLPMTGVGISKGTASYTALTYLSLFGLAITVPLLLLFGVLLIQSASAQREQLDSRVLQVLDALVNDIDRDLDRDITILQTLATSQALASEDWRTFYDQAKAGLQGRAYLILVDSDGRQLINTYVPYGEQPAITGDPETVRRMAQTKAPVVSNLFTSLVVKRPVFNVSIPVLRDNQLRFVMSLGLLPDDLLSLLASQQLGPEWVTMIWDANGVVLARSRDHARFLGTNLPQNMREQSHQAIVRTTNLDGTDVLHATARSNISRWGVGVNVPYSLIGQQMRNLLLLWGAGAVLAITIALAFGLFFARQITTSLIVASKAAAAFGRGQPLPITNSRLKEADAFLATLRGAQRELSDHMNAQRRAEEQFQLAVEAAPNGMIMVNSEGRITLVNEQAERLFGYARQELLGQEIGMLVPERFRGQHPAYQQGYMAHPIPRLMGTGRDVYARCKDGTEIPVEIGLSTITTAQGAMVLSAIVDITDRKKAEEAQRLIIGELKHRTANLLTIVQAIISNTLKESKTIAEAGYVLSGRVQALSNAYSLLADAAWEGASLAKILSAQTILDTKHVTIDGCDIILAPRAAQQFAMIVHELATNALKYGALSSLDGPIAISGKINGYGGGRSLSLFVEGKRRSANIAADSERLRKRHPARLGKAVRHRYDGLCAGRPTLPT
jgi:PAS domain S-box-containing protein